VNTVTPAQAIITSTTFSAQEHVIESGKLPFVPGLEKHQLLLSEREGRTILAEQLESLHFNLVGIRTRKTRTEIDLPDLFGGLLNRQCSSGRLPAFAKSKDTSAPSLSVRINAVVALVERTLKTSASNDQPRIEGLIFCDNA
jgi:hypothetical protein